MKFLFDNNLPPALARGMHELSQKEPDVECVVALRDKFRTAAPDPEWMAALVSEGGWVVLSIDRFTKSAAEREMLRKQGLTVFVLDRQWSKPYWEQASQLVRWWPNMVKMARLSSKVAMRVPWKFTNKSTFEGIRP